MKERKQKEGIQRKQLGTLEDTVLKHIVLKSKKIAVMLLTFNTLTNIITDNQ